MKKLQLTILAALLGLMMFMGQPHAAIAGPAAHSGLHVSEFDGSTASFGVSILGVGPDAVSTVPLGADGTYHIAGKNQGFTVIRVNATVSGYNLYETAIGNSTFNEVIDAAYAGQIYTIVNGEITSTQAAVTAYSGFDVVLTAEVNVITILYIGRDTDGNRVYDSSTFTVRVGDLDELATSPLQTTEVPVTVNIDDNTNKTVDLTGILTRNYYSGLDRAVLFRPSQDLTVSYDGGTDDSISKSDNELELVDISSSDSITIDGHVNSTGFVGEPYFGNFNISALLDYWYYLDDTWPLYTAPLIVNATSGMTFVQHAGGLELASDIDSITLYRAKYTDYAQSEFSIVTVADYGDWSYDDDLFGTLDIDLQSQFKSGVDGTLNGTKYGVSVPSDENIADAAGWDGGFFGSNDFVVNSYGVKISAQNTNVETFVRTSTVDSPGFGIVVTMAGVALMAYVAPRMKKE